MAAPKPPPPAPGPAQGPARRRCSCASMIWLLPTPGGGTMPVDIGHDPQGSLIGVWVGPRGRAQRGVRPLTRAERDDPKLIPAGPRFTPHWATCPHAGQYRAQARRQAPETFPERAHGRVAAAGAAGPCGRCGGPNPNRYGPGATVLCPTCRPPEKGE